MADGTAHESATGGGKAREDATDVDGKAREDATDEDETKGPNQLTGSAWPTPPHSQSSFPPGQASDAKDATADGKAHGGEGAPAGGKAREDATDVDGKAHEDATDEDETRAPNQLTGSAWSTPPHSLSS